MCRAACVVTVFLLSLLVAEGEQNVLLNETFNSLDGWEARLPEGYQANIQYGCAHIWGDSGFLEKPHIARTVTLDPDASEYHLELDYRARSASSISSTTNSWISFNDPETGLQQGMIWLVHGGTQDSGWYHGFGEVTAALEGMAEVEIRLGYSDSWVTDWDHEVWFDDLVLTSVPVAPPPVSLLTLKWTYNVSNTFAGHTFGAGHQGCQTVWDVDGDGTNEIIFGTRRGDSKRLWCIDPDGAFEWLYPPIDEDGLPGDPTSKVSLVDVDNDGRYELALAGRGGRLHVIMGNGSLLWVWDNPNQGEAMHGAPQALDVDGDGFVEFFLNDNSGFIHRVNHLGQLVWTSSQAGAGNQGHPTICDIDQDDRYEILFASQDDHLWCISAETASHEWIFNAGANMQQNQVIVADVNNDGEYEAIIWTDAAATAPANLHIVSFYGTELGRWTHPRNGSNIRICQAMGDVDGDGSMDMVLMTGDGAFCIDVGASQPTTKWEINFTQWCEDGLIPHGATSDHYSSYQLIADIDGDDEQEILWLAPYPMVTDGATGQPEAYYLNDHIALNRRQENGGWWGDVDNDGESEWIVELNGNSHPETMVYCLTLNGTFPADSAWPEYYHSAYPGEYQQSQDWLMLKGAYSNSLWFPLQQAQPSGAIISIRQQPLAADLNRDEAVDIFDLVMVALAFGTSQGEQAYDDALDLNDDGTIDIFDLVLVGRCFGEDNSVELGGQVFVEVSIQDVVDLYRSQFDVSYDPEVLEFVDMIEGPFLGGDETPTFWVTPTVNQTVGRISGCAATRLGAPSGVTGSGTIAIIEFTAKERQTTNLNLEGIALSDTYGRAIANEVESGEVQIG